MMTLTRTVPRAANQNTLTDSIRLARSFHAEKLAAYGSLHDAAILRLQCLKEELTQLLANPPPAGKFIDLVLVPGHPPRLWIDMISHVTMAPDPSTYRLQRDSFCGHEILLESTSRSAIAAAAVTHVANHLVEREKRLTLVPPAEVRPPARIGSVILAWLSGLTFGICLMLLLAHWPPG